MKKSVLATIFAIAAATPAFAFWSVQNSGEDVFGNVNVTANSLGDNGSLIRFECGSSSEPFFVFLLRDSSGEIPDMPAKFLHRDQAGKRHSYDATLSSWNDRFVAVKVTDTAALKGVAEHMITAKSSISLGVSIPLLDLRVADTFSSRGSTAAGRTLLEYCLK